LETSSEAQKRAQTCLIRANPIGSLSRELIVVVVAVFALLGGWSALGIDHE